MCAPGTGYGHSEGYRFVCAARRKGWSESRAERAWAYVKDRREATRNNTTVRQLRAWRQHFGALAVAA